MKTKILLFIGFWWLFASLVEASWLTRPTSKTKYSSSSTVLTKNADGTTSSTTFSSSSTAKSWYPTQPSGSYYYAPSPGGAGPNVIDLGKPVADVIGAVGELGRNVICLFGVLCRSSGSIGETVREAKQLTERYQSPQPAIEPAPEEIPKTEPQIREESLFD